jgi:anti-anti-sigma factor
MNVTETRAGGHVVVTPTGRLDSATSSAFERQLAAIVSRGDARIVLDLGGVDYISSVGLSAILSAAKKVKAANGRLALAGLNDRVRLVFEMSGFLRLLPAFPSVAEAVAA